MDSDPTPTITIQVYNYSRASRATLNAAENEASRILGKAGVRAVWLECPVEESNSPQSRCQHPLDATDNIRLRVLASDSNHNFSDIAFGVAIPPFLVSVFYDYAVRHAKGEDARFEIPIILGCVVAHELGHLLLGPNHHSRTGIMQPRWEDGDVQLAMMGGLVFTAQQSKIMQESARRRTGPAPWNLEQVIAGR